MFDLDRWYEIFSTLRHNKLRTLMTASGVFWGILMLVSMLGFGNGLEAGVAQNMFGFVTNSVYVWGGRTRLAYQGRQPGRWLRFTSQDTKLLAQVQGLAALAPRIQLGGWEEGNNVTFGEKTGNFGVMGEVPEVARIETLIPYEGRFLNQLDLSEQRKVTVIGEQVRRTLFPDDSSPLGQFVKIRGVYFQVVGVTRSDLSGQRGDRENNTLSIPLTTFRLAFNAQNQVGWFALMAEPQVAASEVEKEARELLRERHMVHPEDTQAIGSFNAGERLQRVQRLFRGIKFFIWFVSIATLLAGVLGVSNIMMISVKERTREFGIRKALGATPWRIVSLVIEEATLLTALSGYSGLVAGVVLLEALGPLLGSNSGPLAAPRIEFGSALLATLVVVVAGVCAGIAPASHAARIQPVAALRNE